MMGCREDFIIKKGITMLALPILILIVSLSLFVGLLKQNIRLNGKGL